MSGHVDQKAAESEFDAELVDQPMKLGMCKMGDVTEYTLDADAGEAKAHMRAFGTKNPDFFFGLLHQVVNTASKGQYPDERGIKFMLGFIKSNKPRDEIEASLCAQIAACQLATMRFGNRLAHAESLQEQDSAERTFNKLARTFAALVQALQRYRSAGGAKVVQNVFVGDGGVQPERDSGLKKRRREMLALADARQPRPRLSANRRARGLPAA
jgi:hypothetical protein